MWWDVGSWRPSRPPFHSFCRSKLFLTSNPAVVPILRARVNGSCDTCDAPAAQATLRRSQRMGPARATLPTFSGLARMSWSSATLTSSGRVLWRRTRRLRRRCIRRRYPVISVRWRFGSRPEAGCSDGGRFVAGAVSICTYLRYPEISD